MNRHGSRAFEVQRVPPRRVRLPPPPRRRYERVRIRPQVPKLARAVLPRGGPVLALALRGGGVAASLAVTVVESFSRSRPSAESRARIRPDREPPDPDLRRASASRTLDDRLPARAGGPDGRDRRRVREVHARGAPRVVTRRSSVRIPAGP